MNRIIALLEKKPHTIPELSRAMGYAGRGGAGRILKTLVAQKIVGVVDWTYSGVALVPTYGLSSHSLSRKDWRASKRLPKTKKMLAADAMVKYSKTIHPMDDVNNIVVTAARKMPDKVKQAFKNGASFVCLDGVHYRRGDRVC